MSRKTNKNLTVRNDRVMVAFSDPNGKVIGFGFKNTSMDSEERRQERREAAITKREEKIAEAASLKAIALVEKHIDAPSSPFITLNGKGFRGEQVVVQVKTNPIDALATQKPASKKAAIQNERRFRNAAKQAQGNAWAERMVK